MCRRSSVLLVLGLVGIAAVDGGSPGKLVRQVWGRGYRAEKSYNVGAKGEGDFSVVSPLDEAALGNSCLSRLERKRRWVAPETLPRGHGLKTDNGEPSSGCTTPEVVMRGGSMQASPSKKSSTQAYRSAVLRTSLLFLSAVTFCLGTGFIKGRDAAAEFFTAYVVEQSLSVDNLFIFIMLFDYFKVPSELQSRVLNWGIIGAVSMRAIMIVVGVKFIERFRWATLVFAGILVFSSANLMMESDDDDPADSSHLENNTVLRIAKWVCNSTDYYDGEKFFTLVDGVRKATPLLLCLVCIEMSDFVFAVDSIPAVLGISHDTFVVYASNVFAICAMRSIYTLVSNAISDLPYLKPAVALVLGFVGLKMLAEYFHYDVSTVLSLSVVCGILSVGAVASVVSNRRRDSAAALTNTISSGVVNLNSKPLAGGATKEVEPVTSPSSLDPMAHVEIPPACVSMDGENGENGEEAADVGVGVGVNVDVEQVKDETEPVTKGLAGGDQEPCHEAGSSTGETVSEAHAELGSSLPTGASGIEAQVLRKAEEGAIEPTRMEATGASECEAATPGAQSATSVEHGTLNVDGVETSRVAADAPRADT